MSQQFLIVGAPRTGSTLLVKTLNGLEQICCHGELLGPDSVRGFEDGFDLMAATQDERQARQQRLVAERDADPVAFVTGALSGSASASGFKSLYQTLLLPQWSSVIASLVASPALKVIHLKRQNTLRRYISEQVLQGGGAIHSEPGGRSEQKVKVTIDIAAFVARNEELDTYCDDFFMRLSSQSVLELTYEELAVDTAAAVGKTCQFLGVDIAAGTIEPALRKVGATDLRDSVSNCEELLAHEATREMVLRD